MSSKPDYRIEFTMRYLREDGTFDTETRINRNCTTRKGFDDAMEYYAQQKNCIGFKSLGGIK